MQGTAEQNEATEDPVAGAGCRLRTEARGVAWPQPAVAVILKVGQRQFTMESLESRSVNRMRRITITATEF